MAKVTLTDLTSGFGSVSTMNANNAAIESAFSALAPAFIHYDSTYQKLTSPLTLDAWTSVNIPALATLQAEKVLVKLDVSITSGSAAGDSIVFTGALRTEAGPGADEYTRILKTSATCSVAGITVTTYQTTHAWITLDGDFLFQYYLSYTGTGTVDYANLYIVGYIN